MMRLSPIKFDGTSGMHEYILKMKNLAPKLKDLGINVDKFFFIQFILISLPPQYRSFQIHYDILKDKQNANELVSWLI
jgi:hypothetical protein